MHCSACQQENRFEAVFCRGCGRVLPQLDLCFVIDATGSMRKYIAATCDALTTFAQRLSSQRLQPGIEYGLVLYRDYPATLESPTTRCYPFTEHLGSFQEVLRSIKVKGGGGDGAEAVADGLYEAYQHMDWREHAHKVLVLVGDAPPHGYGHLRDSYPDQHLCPCGRPHGLAHTIARSARQEQDMTIFCLGIGSDAIMQTSFAQIAEAGGGRYVPIDSVINLIDTILALMMAEVER